MNSQEFFTKMEQYIQQELQSGCDYNILLALYKDSNEMNLHSRFIYSLLNPNGYHYKGDSFLKEFLKICGCDFTFDMKKIEVLLEYSTTEYRRVDLVIKDGTKCVIIENKVNAKDSKKQLVDYIKHFCRKEKYKRENIYAIYLSPDGRYPSKASIGNYRIEDGYLAYGQSKVYVDVKFKSISYQKEIKEWIKSCKKYCSSDMKLILNQYLSVLKSLNGELEYQRDKLKREYYETNLDQISTFYSMLDTNDKNTIDACIYDVIDNFIDKIVEAFDKQKIGKIKAWNWYLTYNGWMSICSNSWMNNKDELILFWIYEYKDRLFIKICPNTTLIENQRRRKGKTAKINWDKKLKEYCEYDIKKEIKIDNIKINQKLDLARAIIKKELNVDEILEQIVDFVKLCMNFIERINNKTHEFWKNLPKP
ncbi:PD-(D/E)XK nuclease family protein [Campylobacter sp. RM13119]|uniref:PDDEXK-like family protein n=1 Tax=Campylobacter californiensis TaxID=1032243 RepID=UPI0014732A28|nr:PD-(D/E)XK nuclease family protein [Campylobacter sp. RM13119]MBE3606121.1 PD-(D/E)XK nuclease family protein [Campylobacter sp. RM13119]